MRSLSSADSVEPSDEGSRAAELVQLRPIEIDDWSDVRYVHGTSFRTIVGPRASQRAVEDFMSSLDTLAYVEKHRDADLVGAWFDGQLAGTVGWRPQDGQGRVARIESLFVQPLFTFMGIGSLLLAHAEGRARRAGYASITALACAPSAAFFMRAGYDVYAQGPGVCEFADDMAMFVMRKQEPAASKADFYGAALLLPSAAAEDEVAPVLMGERALRGRGLLVED